MKYSRPQSMRGLRLNWRLPKGLSIGSPQFFVEYGDIAIRPNEPLNDMQWFIDLDQAEAFFDQMNEEGLHAFFGECGIGEVDGLKNPVADRWIFRWNCFFDLEVQQERFVGFPASSPKRAYLYEPLNLEAVNTFYFGASDDAVSPMFESPNYDDDDLVCKRHELPSQHVQPGPDEADPTEEDTWARISR